MTDLHRQGTPWTDEDKALLTECVNEKHMRFDEAAPLLFRRVTAVRVKAVSLGLTIHPSAYKPKGAASPNYDGPGKPKPEKPSPRVRATQAHFDLCWNAGRDFSGRPYPSKQPITPITSSMEDAA